MVGSVLSTRSSVVVFFLTKSVLFSLPAGSIDSNRAVINRLTWAENSQNSKVNSKKIIGYQWIVLCLG